MKGYFMGQYDLYNLAANDIINFDADAYVKGLPPRFVGNPAGYVGLPFEQPLPGYGIYPGQHLAGAPARDAFVNHNKAKEPLNWKEALLGTILGGVSILGGLKIAKAIKNAKAKKLAKAQASQTTGTAANAAASTATATATATAANTAQAAPKIKKSAKIGKFIKDTFSKGKNWFSNLPKGGKIAVGAGGALAGLFIIFKIFSGKNNNDRIPGTSIRLSDLQKTDTSNVGLNAIPEANPNLESAPEANPQLEPIPEEKPQV